MTNPIPPAAPGVPSPEEFLNSLARVPWFGRLGRPSPRDHRVARIRGWHEWPGPESPQVRELGPRSQAWRDELTQHAGVRQPEIESWWERIQQAVFEHACGAVTFDPEGDSWHGPTAAVWHASWVAGVVGCGLLLERASSPEAIDQWSWLVEGHWPCGYAFDPVEGEPIVLMVL